MGRVVKFATPKGDPRELVAALNTRMREHADFNTIKGIGISFAGPLNNGIVSQAPNIWGEQHSNIPLERMIAEATGKPVRMFNDMDSATAREKDYGVGVGVPSFLLTTVSSGVGGRQVINGEVVVGERGIAGEIGHIVLERNSTVKCGCGRFGHLESLASGKGATRVLVSNALRSLMNNDGHFRASALWQSELGRMSAEELPSCIEKLMDNFMLAKAVEQEDKFALEVLDQVAWPMAMGINIVSALSMPTKVFIMGGFGMGMGEPYLRLLKSNLVKLGMIGIESAELPAFADNLIAWATKDDNSGLIGSATLAEKHIVTAGA
jgi:predicted NBD/HSP70 family sugar kinase